MSTTGLDVFDKTLQITNTWLDEIMAELGPDRQVAWHVLNAVLRTLRDRLPIDLSAHLASQLPVLVRGTYYEQWQPGHQPDKARSTNFSSRWAPSSKTSARSMHAMRRRWSSTSSHDTWTVASWKRCGLL